MEISGNSISRANGRGIGPHNSHEVTITGNTAYDCDQGQVEFNHDVISPNDPVRNITMNNNIFVAKRANQDVLAVRTKDDDVAQMGTFDNNYYCRPLNDRQSFHTYTYFSTPSVVTKTYDVAHWSTAYGYDKNSKKSPVSIAPYTISSTSANMVTNGTFDNNIKNIQTPTPDRTSVQYDAYGLDGGDLKVSYTGGSNSSLYQSIQFYDPAAAGLQSGHTYRVKFSARAGSDNNTDFYGSLLPAYGGSGTDAKPFKVNNSRNEIELLYTPTVNITHPYFEIYTQVSNECPVYWLDNLVIQEVYSITNTNPDDYFRFEYNATTSSKTVPLDATYVDMKNNQYSGSVTLSPFTSVVLVKTGSSLVQPSSAASNSAAPLEEAAADNVALLDLKVTPNPAVDKIQLTVKVPQGNARVATLIIYSASGAVVNTREIAVLNGPLTIDVAALTRGVYTVKLVYGTHTTSKRFVKM